MHRRPQFEQDKCFPPWMAELKVERQCASCASVSSPIHLLTTSLSNPIKLKPKSPSNNIDIENCCGTWQPCSYVYWSHSLSLLLDLLWQWGSAKQTNQKRPYGYNFITSLDLCYSILCLYFFPQKTGAVNLFTIKLLWSYYKNSGIFLVTTFTPSLRGIWPSSVWKCPKCWRLSDKHSQSRTCVAFQPGSGYM